MMLEDMLQQIGDDRLSVAIDRSETEHRGRYLDVAGLRWPEPEAWACGDATPGQLQTFIEWSVEETGLRLSTMMASALTTLGRSDRPGL